MARFFIVAGGTGGHVFPALALVRALQSRRHEVHFVTDRRGMRFCADMPHHLVACEAFGGRGMLGRLKALLMLSLGYGQSLILLRDFRPDGVIGFGGYASLPIMLAAQHYRVRTVVHEQNAVMGRVNRFLAKRASLVALSFAQTRYCPAGGRSSYIGNPVVEARQTLSRERETEGVLRLLVLGGSQGTAVFDDLLIEAIGLIPEDIRKKIDIVQQVACLEPDELMQCYQKLGVMAVCARFIDGIAAWMSARDLVIARAGGGTCAEISNAGLPALFVPLPSAADNHQWGNAEYYVEGGGALMIGQAELSAEFLALRIVHWLSHPEELEAMSRAMRELSRPEALRDFVCSVENEFGISEES